MRRILILMLLSGIHWVCNAWTFTDVNAPGATSDPSFYNSSITWRPQGDYAILANTNGLYRYDYPSGTLAYQAFSGSLYRAAFAPDGSYALITGGSHIYRYEHAEVGFGTLTEITDIESPGSATITFYDIVWNPVEPDGPAFICCNRGGGSSHQLVVYRYDPDVSPMVYSDYSGGTFTSQYAFAPISTAFQADGDYMVIGCTQSAPYCHGFFVFDPDQSTFPVQAGNLLQYFGNNFYVGNTNTVAMSPVSGKRFVLVRGNGRVVRWTQQSLPATFILDYPDWYTAISGGDSDYNTSGTIGLFLERQEWSPNHHIMVNDADGNEVTNALPVTSAGFTNQTLRIYAVEWNPTAEMGLMAGEDRWIFRFDSEPIPTPASTVTPTPTPVASATPEPPVIPSSGQGGIVVMMILGGLLLAGRQR